MDDGKLKMKNCELSISIEQQKSKVKSQKIFLLLFLFFPLAVYSQSVDSLINEAIQNNPQLKALELKIQSFEYRSESVGYLPPPTLGVEFSQVPTDEINIWDKALSQNLSITQMIPLGGKLSAMENAENKKVDLAKTDYDFYKLQLISKIKKLYYDTWMTEHHSELRDETINLLEAVYKSTEQQYQVNNARYSDLLLIQAEIASNKTEVEVLDNKALSLIYEMNALIGRDVNDEEIAVQHNWEIDTSAININKLKIDLIVTNPSLEKMERMIEMNQLEIEANNKELIPDLMVGGMIMRMPQGMFLTTKTSVHSLDGNGEVEIMYGLMASITLPFAPWSSGKYSAKEEELLTGISSFRSEKENMQREMIAELKSMVNELENARKEIKLYSEQVIPLYKKTIEAQLVEFQNNKININSLLETLRMLLMKEEELAEAQTKHQMVLAEIESLTGWTE
ncbi:MAG TPA: TolC family protein [Ignavibacteriaceae bacterium]|nr:TolC family protein [Ignavibacteriaceae bacterium]